MTDVTREPQRSGSCADPAAPRGGLLGELGSFLLARKWWLIVPLALLFLLVILLAVLGSGSLSRPFVYS
ncbi:MAG: hypothetical protein HY815_04320 [Candidatus Riflebacteria bacterium]|nr:hypothetical protein [Candidatus Riflebacteria bacterium]